MGHSSERIERTAAVPVVEGQFRNTPCFVAQSYFLVGGSVSRKWRNLDYRPNPPHQKRPRARGSPET
jgi:hypothetical protein